MLVDNDRAAQLDLWTVGFVTSNPVCLGVQDLLDDRRILIMLLAAEYTKTEKQAADLLGIDRLAFRVEREQVLRAASDLWQNHDWT